MILWLAPKTRPGTWDALMRQMWLLLGLATFLAACTSESAAPAAKAPAISAEVAAAPGRLYLDDGRVEPADRWWESGDILFYEWNGERRRVLKERVARIDGAPRPRETVVGVASPSTLGSATTRPSSPPQPASPPLASSALPAAPGATTAPPRPPVAATHAIEGTLTLYTANFARPTGTGDGSVCFSAPVEEVSSVGVMQSAAPSPRGSILRREGTVVSQSNF
jgi:hypothetical protein